MERGLKSTLLTVILFLVTAVCTSPSDWNNSISKDDILRDTISKGGFTLFFINKDSTFDKQVQEAMINTFFTVYRKEVITYNPGSFKKVTIIIDPEYKGVAATAGGIVRVNPAWMHKHPNDIDVVTHDGMPIVQSYPDGAVPGWITEGIADYARNEFGVNNTEGGWKRVIIIAVKNTRMLIV